MRELSTTLLAAQKAYSKNPLYKVVLTNGATSYTYDKERILPSSHDEGMYSQKAIISLDNSDHEFDDKDLKGFDAVISYGYKTPAGNEYLESAALVVMDPQFDSDPNKLTCTLELWGIPDLMGEDKASGNYIPDSDATETVKDLINAIAGATLSPFTHCKAYEVVWESGYDILADTYQPKDGFRIYTRGTRLAAFRRLMDYTGNVPRFGADGKIHILKPVTTGTTFDYEYSLAKGAHVFFRKAYRDSLVIPNRVVVQSRSDDDPFYSGSAQISNYASLPDKVKKTDFIECPLASNAQATAIAEALIAKAEMGSKRGEAPVPLNIGAEVFDYVKITDSRQGDSRTGNLGYVHRRFGPDKWEMAFGFGNWLEMLRYNAILKQLETYTDAGQYFNRLTVKDLYAENLTMYMDEITDGPDVYVRQRSLQLNATGLYLADDTLYTIRVPGGPQHNLRKSDTAPTTPATGDFWIDTNYVPNPLKMWDGASWDLLTAAEVAEFNRGTIYRELKSVALTADGLVILDQVQVGTYGLVKSASLSAGGLVLLDQVQDGTYGKLLATQISAGKIYISSANEFATGYDPSGKSKVFRQASAPTAETIGDLWVDTDDANKLYRWSGTSWVSIRDSDISQALQDAAEAYAYADDAYTLADGAYTLAADKTKIFRQATDPGSAAANGDLWYHTDDPNGADWPYRKVAGSWVSCVTAVDGGHIVTGTINCQVVAIETAGSGDRVVLDTNGIKVYGETLAFYYGTTCKGFVEGLSDRFLIWADGCDLNLLADNDVMIDPGTGKGTYFGGGFIELPAGTSDPAGGALGAMYYNTSTGWLRVYAEGSWHGVQLK